MPDAVKRHVFAIGSVTANGHELCRECAANRDAPQHLPAVELSTAGRSWHAQLRGIEESIAAVKKQLLGPLEMQREVALRNLQAELGDNEAATIDGRPVVTWAWSKPGDGVDVARLKREQPAIFEAYCKPKTAARPFKAVA